MIDNATGLVTAALLVSDFVRSRWLGFAVEYRPWRPEGQEFRVVIQGVDSYLPGVGVASTPDAAARLAIDSWINFHTPTGQDAEGKGPADVLNYDE